MKPKEWELMPPVDNVKDAMLRILNRADSLAVWIGWQSYSRIALMMDIQFVHQDICKLDVIGLANARTADFNHDVIGIWNHYNRVTGQMEGSFMPRCAITQEA